MIITKHVSSSAADFTKYAFQCCDTPEATSILKHYLNLTESLGDDDAEKSAKNASLLHQKLSTSTIDSELRRVFSLEDDKWNDIKSIRSNLSIPSSTMIQFIHKHRSSTGTEKIAIAFCPMAPGRWLQRTPIIHNPYFGSTMLTCGVIEEAK